MSYSASAPTSALMPRLRAATEAHHRRIEQVIDPIARLKTRQEYGRLLQRLWGFYAPLEERLVGLPWAEADLSFADRRKIQWLEEDLRTLGLKSELPIASSIPSLRTLAEGVGCLYVLEGATLGGQVIGKHLLQIGVTANAGGKFYASYGDKIGQRWMEFKEAANAYCQTEVQLEEATRGAVATFEAFETWFKDF